MLSLDERGADGISIADRLGETNSLSTWHGHCVALEAAIDARIDLARALGALRARDRSLCAAARQCPVRALVERGLGSRATLYRGLRDLRCALAALGARAA